MPYQKVKITERALFQRLKRFLEKEENITLKKCRPGPNYQSLGDYYMIDLNRNFIVKSGYDLQMLEDFARKKNVLGKFEEVEK